MAEETPVKGKHRKLKRIVQKKAKVGLNTSGSVSYYKKVKAALNASLNSSRIRKSLAANNRALAQSLQQVKQELRNAYNEIAHLKVENQEMTIRLMRSEQLQSGSGDQAILEQRLRSLRSLLHEMSRHLLDVGTCLNDGIDLCLLTPRTSQGSNTTLLPSCPGDFILSESRKSNELDATAAKDVDSVLTESGGPEITSVFSNMGYGVPSTKAVALPDMSIIMEQSLIDVDEDTHLEPVQMDTVFEEVTTPASSGAKNVLMEKAKKTTDNKPPQRVLITCRSKSDLNDEPFSGKQMLVAKDNQTTSSTNDKNADSAGKACRRGAFILSSATVGRRETFVVNKDALALALEGENGEGIESVEMPDLVSDGSFSDVEDCRPNCKEGANSEGKQSAALQLSESNSYIKTEEPLNGSKVLNVTNKEMNKENSQGKATKHFSKFKKPTAPVLQCMQKVKDSSFFITNPCALNLVHQRVTCSKDGCLNSDIMDSFTTVCASSSASSFVEEIKASNRASDKIASIISLSGDKKDSSDGTQCLPNRTENQNQEISDKLEPEISDCTMYFNTDMEFTEMIPQALSLGAMPEEITEEKSAKNVSTNLETENAKKGVDDENVSQEIGSKARSGIKPSKTSGIEDSIYNSRHTSSTDDKKIPVALRVSKPGQMVFAVSRKEEDGSRKAIPAKLSTKSRSKSKKEVEEMKKHLSAEEPKTIFDFHDKTPQHNSDKSKAASSIFDLSVGESVPTSVPSLASVREKLKTLGRELGCSVVGQDLPESKEESLSSSTKSELELNKKPRVTTLLGDAPEYRLPLKMDNSPYLVKNKSGGGSSRPRSSSRGRDSQSRSKSRSRKDKVAEKEENVDERIAGESRTAESSAGEIQEPSMSGSRMRVRSRSRHRKSSDQCQSAPADTENPLEPRRSARSKSSVRKRYAEEDSTGNLDDSLNMDSAKESVKNQDRVCGGGKKHDEDSNDKDYNPFFAKNKSSKQRGRSRSKRKIEKHGSADHVKSADIICNNSASDKDLEGREAESQACRSNKIKSQKNGDDVCDKAQSTACALNAGASEGTRNMSAQVSTSIKDVDGLAGGTTKMVERRHRSKSRHKKLPGESDYVEVPACTSNKEVDVLVGGSTKMIERQHRSKSKHRKLPDESENAEEASLFISTKDVDVLVGANTKVSVRRHRSKSIHGKLHSESESGEEAFESLSTDIPVLGKNTVKETKSSSAECLADQQETKNKHVSSSSGDCLSGPDGRLPRQTLKERKITQQFSSSKDNLGKECKAMGSEKRKLQNKEDNESPVPAKKSKQTLPLLNTRKQEGEECKLMSAVTKNTASKKIKQGVQKFAVEVDYYQQLEEVKQKLEELDQSTKNMLPEQLKQPCTKSSPLVLSTFLSSSTVQKSPVTKHDAGKAKLAHPLNKERSTCVSTSSSTASSARTSSDRDSLQTLDSDNDSAQNGRPLRRAGSAVSYKEPSLSKKLRREDPQTSILYKGKQQQLFKSPKSHRKHFDPNQRERGIFMDLTNLSIVEAEGYAK